jgi:hypothetical protein
MSMGGNLMSLLHTRDAILRRGAVQNAVLLLAVVAAIVVGLLAMHTFASSMGSHEQPAAAAMAMGSPAVHVDEMTAGDGSMSTAMECSGLCDPGHSMATMACILALVFTALALATARRADLLALLPRVRMTLFRAVALAALTSKAPPDLNVLSISRT